MPYPGGRPVGGAGSILRPVRPLRGRWASFAANRHLYNSQGQLAVGRVLDRDGDVLSWVDEDGERAYYANETVRRATLHAVGDAQGKIGTGALTAFADKLSGYNLLTGALLPPGGGQRPLPHPGRPVQLHRLPGPERPQGGGGGVQLQDGRDPVHGLRPLLRSPEPARRPGGRTPSTRGPISTASSRAPLCPGRCTRRWCWPPPWRISRT